MEIGETTYAATRRAWRKWLQENYDRSAEIWLVSYKKASKKASVPYNDAVEEALCFGWIDSIRKTLNQEAYAQRFSPRRQRSEYSQINRERLAQLLRAGLVIPEVAAGAGDVRPESYVIPADIISALEARPEAWSHWQRFSPSYQRIRAAYVDTARNRGGEFRKRLENLVRHTSEGRQFGYGIEQFY